MNSVQELVYHICIHVYVFITGISLFFEKQQIFMKIQLGVKTNGNFGGFPVGNDILSKFGISLGNPHDVCYLKNLHNTYYTQVVDYLLIPVLCIYAAAVTAAAAELPTWYSRDTMLSSF